MNRYKTYKEKGFTLIELLVVITIVGILSSVVLISVNDVSAKAKDNASKAELVQLRLLAVQHNSSTDWFCEHHTTATDTNNNGAKKIIESIAKRYDNNGIVFCDTESAGKNKKWVAGFILESEDDAAFCVDHKGTAKEIEDIDKVINLPADGQPNEFGANARSSDPNEDNQYSCAS